MSESIWPLRIFISSAMKNSKEPERERVLKIRAKVYNLLSSYSFLEPYRLEEEDSSVLGLQTTFLSQLRDSNLVIFILDSRFPIPDGVQEEITTSRQEKIVHVYFILPGEHEEAEAMKQELLDQGEANYLNVVENSKDYATVIVDAVLGQLVKVFRAFSNKGLVPLDDIMPMQPEQSKPSFPVISTFTQFSSEMFGHVDLTRQFVRQLVYHVKPDNGLSNPQSGIDQAIFDMLKRLFNNVPLPFSWDTMMLEAIKTTNSKSPIPNALITVIKTRLRAVTLFFSEKYDQAFECLKELLSSPEIENIPTWILQDVLIDLRNLLEIKDELHNKHRIRNEYQTKLDECMSPFYYPGIDQSIKSVQDWVLSERTKHSTASSSEKSIYFSGINIYSDQLLDSEIFACCNGSITQIRQLPKNLNIISEMLLQHYEERVYLLDVVQNLLLMGKPFSYVNRWLNRFSFLHGQFTDCDAMTIIERIDSYPIHIERLAVKATTLRIFADCLSVEHFKQIWPKLFKEILEWEKSKTFIIYPAKEILGLFRNCYRIPRNDVITIIALLSKRPLVFKDDVADIIFGAIDYKNTTSAQRIIIVNSLLNVIKSAPNTTFTPQIENALIVILASWPKESYEISNYLKKNMSEYFADNILPCLWKDTTDPEFKTFMEKQIALMVSQNSSQTSPSRRTFGTDPFAPIANTIRKGVNIDHSYELQIIQAIVASINNPYQTIDTKLSAVELMLILTNTNHQWLKFANEIDINSMTAQSSEFFDTTTPTLQIEAMKTFIELTRSGVDNGSLLRTLTLSQSPQYIFFIAKLLVNFLPIMLQSTSLASLAPQILQFIIMNNDPHHRENKLLFKISQCLLILMNDDRYNGIAIGQIQRLVSDTNNVVLRDLVNQISVLPTNQQNNLDSIKQQLLNNSSYSVQDLAHRYFNKK